jgi:hypothetical protein
VHIHACVQDQKNPRVLKILCGEAALAVQLDGGPRFFWPLMVRFTVNSTVKGRGF